jgi:hypothetical protein
MQGTVAAPSQQAGWQDVRLVAWNLNSGVNMQQPDADVAFIVDRLAGLGGVTLLSFSEVNPLWRERLDQALGAHPHPAPADAARASYLTDDGRAQRLYAVWDHRRFEALEVQEIGRVDADGYGRAPLGVLLRERATDVHALWITVHFRSGRAEARLEEARILADLVEQLDWPTVISGDFNMRCAIGEAGGLTCDDAWTALTASGWIQEVSAPQGWVATMCSARGRGSVEDRVAVGGAARGWGGRMRVVTEGAWCDDGMGRGAHRPIEAVW